MQSLNHRYVFTFYFTRIFASMEFSNNFSNTKYISHLKSNNSKVIMQLLSLVAEKKMVEYPFPLGLVKYFLLFPFLINTAFRFGLFILDLRQREE